MFKSETESSDLGLNYRTTCSKSSAFLKAGARLTILSVLSNKVKAQSAVLLNKEKPKQKETDSKPQVTQNVSMTTTCVAAKPASLVNDRDNQVINKDMEGNNNNTMDMMNGEPCDTGTSDDNKDTTLDTGSAKDQITSKKRSNSTTKHVKFSAKDKTPFDFMAERKLSEPVLSPRKRVNAMTSKMTRCRSTADVRGNAEKPVVRELGGYRFYQKPATEMTSKPNQRTPSNSYRSTGTSNYVNDMATLKKTIDEQKETISKREKHVLQLEKNISALENESLKSKRQIESLRASVEDCTSTVDYLKRDRKALVAEQDRLKFTLLTCEDELKELRVTNRKLVTEYETTEQSRLIAVGHLHELEETDVKSQRSGLLKDGGKFIEQLKSMRDCAQSLRLEKSVLQEHQTQLTLFFKETVTKLVAELEAKKSGARNYLGTGDTSGDAREVNGPEPEEDTEPTDDKDKELKEFKDELKANEKNIDDLANEIRNMENKKKTLLESRFALIQSFQAGQRIVEEELSEKDEDEIFEGTDTYMEADDEDDMRSPTRKQSYRVTKKIRKLERTLSMDNGVGKLDCIQTLCKKLEEREQKVEELEVLNQDLQEENDEMEEETKYLKYVLSYRGDTMKAQLEREYEKKVTDLKEELRVAKETNGDVNHNDLCERNRTLEDEVQRLHEELKSLLLNLPALQNDNEQRSVDTVDGGTSQETGDLVRNLQEQVEQLTAEKRVLLMSIQAMNAQNEPDEAEHDQSMSKSLTVLEKTLREVENENAHFVETFRRIREFLEVDEEHESEQHADSSKISKLKGEIQRLDDARRSLDSDSLRGELAGSCARHEERLSELGKEVVRLHEEKKSLLSTIIRLQADPNFTFSDDVTDDDISRSLLRSPGNELDGLVALIRRENTSSPQLGKDCRDEGVQIGVNDVEGIMGYLEDGLGKLKQALSEQCNLGYKRGTDKEPRREPASEVVEPSSQIGELRRKLEEFEKENGILQENLDESEAIRSDLHRTISIATEMAQEEREKCASIMQTKTALEQDMIKLAKDNQDLRDGMETLSRVRKRRNSRVQYMSLASPTSGGEHDGSSLYLPLADKRHTRSESEISDLDLTTPDGK